MQYKNDGKSEEHYIISELIYRLFAGIPSMFIARKSSSILCFGNTALTHKAADPAVTLKNQKIL